MNELRAVRRLRPDVRPLDQASFDRIWGDVSGAPVLERESSPTVDPDVAAVLELDATPNPAGGRRVLATAAAALLVTLGVGSVVAVRALVDGTAQPAPTAQPPAASAWTAPETPPPATTDAPVLLLPAVDIEPTYVQHIAALPHRNRGLVSAPDGTTLSINLYENFWDAPSTDVEQREIGALSWATMVEDVNRGYVTSDACTMLSLNAGPNGEAWDANAVALMNSVQFSDPITIDLPEGWQIIELGTLGDWYSMSFDPGIEGVPGVTLTQMPGSNAGPLLADLAGRPLTAITIDGNPAWQVPLPEDGWTQTIWQNETGSMMLTAKGLTPADIDQFLTQLSPAPVSDWDTRYSEHDAGPIHMFGPTCEPAALRVNNPGT